MIAVGIVNQKTHPDGSIINLSQAYKTLEWHGGGIISYEFQTVKLFSHIVFPIYWVPSNIVIIRPTLVFAAVFISYHYLDPGPG